MGIFQYVYGVLHHPGLSATSSPTTSGGSCRESPSPSFQAFAKAGEKLAELHLDYETLDPGR